jgi:hypothetical protein
MKHLAIVCVLLFASALPGRADAQWAVVDIVNWIENYEQVVQQYMTRANTYSQLVEFKKKYEDYRETISAIKEVRQLIVERGGGLDHRMGYSFLGLARRLDPDSPTWRRDVEDLLRMHYDMPSIDDLHQEIASAYGGRRGPLVTRALRNNREHLPLLDGYHFQAAQRRASDERRKTLDKLEDTLAGLGDKSETKQLQTIGALLTLQAKQQEAVLDAVQMLSTAQNQQLLLDRSEDNRVFREEMARIKSLPQRQLTCAPNCMARW